VLGTETVPQRVAQAILAMKAIRSITPREAKAVWDSGNPTAGTEILEKRPERDQLDELPDSEILRRSARQLCIATILACNEFQECASTLVAENPAEAAQLLKALYGAVPAAVAAYGEALKSRDHPRPQDNEATPCSAFAPASTSSKESHQHAD
jgi:hypothetical protein